MEPGGNDQQIVRTASHRRVARVAAVQTLYQAEIVHKPLAGAAKEMRKHYLGQNIDGMSLVADKNFYGAIIQAIDENGERLIELLQGAL